MGGPNWSLSLTFQAGGGCVGIEAAWTPFLGSPSFSYPTLILYWEPLPLPHLVIYCCNSLTSKMLHNRPHLGQGGSPGLPPPLGGTPWGQVLRGASLSPTHTCFPPLPGGAQVGHWLILANTSRGRGREGLCCLLAGRGSPGGWGRGWKPHWVHLSPRPHSQGLSKPSWHQRAWACADQPPRPPGWTMEVLASWRTGGGCQFWPQDPSLGLGPLLLCP